MATKTVKRDLLPARSGILRLIPLDSDFRPLYDKAYTTAREYLVSTQVTTTRTMETVPNGNGQDGEFVTGETHNLAVAMNVFDHKLDAFLRGMKDVSSPGVVPRDTTVIPVTASANAEYTFTDAKAYPAKSPDEKYHFEIRDANGNRIEAASGESVSTNDYVYEDSSHKLTFPKSFAGKPLTCVYYVASGEGAEAYESANILETKQYLIEVHSELQSASSGETVFYTVRIARGSVSGDLPGATSQKAKTNTITYNFKSQPVPEGVSALYEHYENAK